MGGACISLLMILSFIFLSEIHLLVKAKHMGAAMQHFLSHVAQMKDNGLETSSRTSRNLRPIS